MGNVIRPFEKPSYTMFHNFAVDVAMPTLSGAGWKILCITIRQTWGWVDEDSPTGRKQSDQISYNQFIEKTGLARSTIARAIKECLDAGYLVRRKVGEDVRSGNPLYAYALNTEYEVSGSKIEPLISGTKIEPLSGSKIEPLSGSKIELTKEIKTTNKNVGVDGDEREEDERVLLILDLAQDECTLLDLNLAREVVDSYSIDQVNNLVTYARKATSLRDPLAFVISRLKSGELPAMSAPDDRDRYTGDIYQTANGIAERDPEPVDPELAKARKIWDAVLDELQLQMTKDTFTTWLKPARVQAYEDNVLTVAVENDYAKDWLENRLRITIGRTLASVVGEEVELVITVDSESSDD